MIYNPTMQAIIFLFIFILITILHLIKCGYNPITCDGIFYYTHLPSFFIYKDLDLSFLPNFINPEIIDEFCVHGYIKYPIGCTYLQTPFFIIAHSLTLIINKSSATGYSVIYQIFMEISSVFFWLIGAILNYKILKNFVSNKNAQLSIIAITLGSGLYYYTCFQATMSHVYSYFAITLFVYIVLKINENKKSFFFILGLSYGLCVAIRNINIILLLFYLLYNVQNFKDFKIRLSNFLNIKNLFAFLSGFIIPIFPQMLYWYNRTGYWIINSYHPEYYIEGYGSYPNVEDKDYFYFTNPKILESLFSLRKGLFIYYPVLILSIFGFKSYKKFFSNLKLALPVLIIIIVYLYSCWGCWYGGSSFGLRFYVDYMVFFSILISSFLENIYINSTTRIYRLNILLLTILILISLNFCYLMNNGYGNIEGSLTDFFKECFNFVLF